MSDEIVEKPEEQLRQLCAKNAEYFAKDNSENGQRLYISFLAIRDNIEQIWPTLSNIRRVAPNYDFDEKTPGNGYRSFVAVVDSAVSHAIELNKKTLARRDSVLFRKTSVTKEIESCAHLFASLGACLTHLETLISWGENGELFPKDERTPEETLSPSENINQYCFYGRNLGFQFCESMRGILRFIGLSMAVFSEAYYSEGSVLSKATNSVMTTTKYFTDPEERAKRIVNISQNAGVDFCKAFWFLSESELMQHLPSVVAQAVAVSKVILIPPEPLFLTVNGREVEVPVPSAHLGTKPVQVRLISHEVRAGMIGEGKDNSKASPPSRGLLVHCHGGGFVAQSSRSHETYLRSWAKDLGIPILSIDYSLAPQAPFPRALEEVTYAYCWAIKNCHLLGSTGERIVTAGDSAGANLLLTSALRCLDLGLPPPHGIFAAYVPTLIDIVPSPARFLCMLDPLLPFGFLMRCLKAYASPKNPDSRDSDSESFEEISESDLMELQAHKSPVSETSDTLSYGSLVEDLNLGENADKTTENADQPAQNAAKTAENADKPAKNAAKTAENPAKTSEVGSTKSEVGIVDSVAGFASATGTDKFVVVKDAKPGENLPDSTANTGENSDSSNVLEKFVLDSEKFALDSEKFVLDPSDTDTDATRVPARSSSSQWFQNRVAGFVAGIRGRLGSFGGRGGASGAGKVLDGEKRNNVLEEFKFSVPKDPYLSPYCADDESLGRLPPVKILTVQMDPCLDDCVMFAKRLKRINHDVHLDILEGLPHGFLNFSLVCKEAMEGAKLSSSRISELLDLNSLPPLDI